MKSKIIIVVAGLLVSAANATELSDQLTQCRTLQNDLQRLTCYDNIGQKTSKPVAEAVVTNEIQNTEIAPTVSSPVTSSPVTVATTNDSFGIEHKIAERTVPSIDSTVVNIEQSKRGFWTVTLDNGQKWRQITSDGFVLRKGEAVVIRRGSFNSFLLTKKGSERQTKVARLQE
ncbi:MAG: hypothetical protein KKF22_12350 [Gammaproteobacteria bacterium]|nr:hypothetical protein [Gammaproteobacteria bacterium]